MGFRETLLRASAAATAMGLLASTVSGVCVRVELIFDQPIDCENALSSTFALSTTTKCEDVRGRSDPIFCPACPDDLPITRIDFKDLMPGCDSKAEASTPGGYSAMAETKPDRVILETCSPSLGDPCARRFSGLAVADPLLIILIDPDDPTAPECPSGTVDVAIDAQPVSAAASRRTIDVVLAGECCAAVVTSDTGVAATAGLTLDQSTNQWKGQLDCGNLCDASGRIGVSTFSLIDADMDLDGDGLLTTKDADELATRIAAGQLPCPGTTPCIPGQFDLDAVGSTQTVPVIDAADVDALRRIARCIEPLLCDVLCSGDVNLDGVVNTGDLLTVLSNFGTGPGLTRTDGDVNCDGFVDSGDLLDVLAELGNTCP